MAKQWKIRRGTSAENDAFTGAIGEVTMDTTNKTLRVHDGNTAGGNSLVSIETLKAIYPVGAVYIGTTSTCPMATFFGTWELVSSGKALWTGNGSNANTTIEAGLPNITGTFRGRNAFNDGPVSYTGAFGVVYSGSTTGASGAGSSPYYFDFDASRSSTIYGNSTTVQPPAYVVNVWRRTA